MTLTASCAPLKPWAGALKKRLPSPRINSIADIDSAFSLSYQLLIGAHDAGKWDGGLSVRFCEAGEMTSSPWEKREPNRCRSEIWSMWAAAPQRRAAG